MQSTVTRAAKLESKGQVEAQAIVAQAILFPFVLVCLCSDRDSVDFPVLSCCCGSNRNSFVEISSSHWGGGAMTVRKEMDGKRVRRRVGKQVKYGWKSFSQRRSPSVVARSGIASTARRQTFGQGQNVASARQILRQCYKASTCKLYQPGGLAAGRNRQIQVKVKTKCWTLRHCGLKRQNCMICEKKGIGLKVKDGNRRCFSDRQVKKSGVKRTGKRKWTEKWTARRSKTSAKERRRSSCERRTILRTCPRSTLLNKKRNGGKNCRTMSKDGKISCQSIRSCRVCKREKQQCQKRVGKWAEKSEQLRTRTANQQAEMEDNDQRIRPETLGLAGWKRMARQQRISVAWVLLRRSHLAAICRAGSRTDNAGILSHSGRAQQQI